MAETTKTEGVILRRWAYKDRDKMVRILTRDHGKVTVRAISARKPTAKLAGHLEPFIHADLFIAKSRTIDILAGSNTIASHARLRQSLPHTALASFYSEVLDRFTTDHDVDAAVFEEARTFYGWLNANPANALALYAGIFRLLGLLGYTLELSTCHACRRPIAAADAKLHFQLWNIECATCQSQDETVALPLSANKIFRFLLAHDLAAVARLQVPPAEWETVDGIFRSLLRYHLGAELRSEPVFLELLQHAARQPTATSAAKAPSATAA